MNRLLRAGMGVALGASIGSGVIAATLPVDSAGLAPIAQSAGRDLYRIEFQGGEPAEVEIESAGAPLTLRVYDANRRLVCRAIEVSSVQRCRWDPSVTASFFIEVRNLNGTTVPYEIRTN